MMARRPTAPGSMLNWGASMSDTLLPHNVTAAELALEAVLRDAFTPPVPLREIWDPATCPVALLPWLAGAFSVDDWDPDWSEDARRAAISQAFPVHQKKGTVGAVKKAVAAAGYGDAVVVERYGWEFHDGQHSRDGSLIRSKPDHWAEYRLRLKRPITREQAAQVRAILANTAPARCHLKALEYPEALHLHNNSIVRDGNYTRGIA